MDDVRCNGHETDIEQCPQNPWRRHNCGVSEAAGVECGAGSTAEVSQPERRPAGEFPINFRPPLLPPGNRLRYDYNYIDWWNWANHARRGDGRAPYPPGQRYPNPNATPAPPPQVPDERYPAPAPRTTRRPAARTTRRRTQPPTTTTTTPAPVPRTQPPTTTRGMISVNRIYLFSYIT